MLHKKPSELTVQDLMTLVDEQYVENDQLEIKKTLPAKGKNQDPWMEGKNQIGDTARNKLVEEIIAFANAHGGTMILGIQETDTKPARASLITPLPGAEELAERLKLQCRDCIEPQLPILEVAAIPTESDGSGVVVFNVPQSRMAPHRHTVTKECYIRRADCTEKMTMREIQDLTLQTERGMSRVDAILNEHRTRFKDEINAFAGDADACFGIRATAVPIVALSVEKVHGVAAVRPPDRNFTVRFNDGGESHTTLPFGGNDWRPILRGSRQPDDHGSSKFERRVYCDGVIDYGLMEKRESEHYGIPVAWALGVLANIICASEQFRKYAGAPSAEYALEIAISVLKQSCRTAGYHRDYRGRLRGDIMEGEHRFPIYSIGPTEELPQLSALFESDFWNVAGLDTHHIAQVDFDEVLSAVDDS